MALRFSTALRNAIASGMSWNEALAKGTMYVYSGSQPADADTDVSGTLLCQFNTDANGVAANYVAPASVVTIANIGGTDGTVTGIWVGGASNSTGFNIMNAAVTANASNNSDTAALVVAAVNAKQNPLGISASANTTQVLLSCPKQRGVDLATVNVFASVTANATVTINGGSSSTLGGTGSANAGVAGNNTLNFQVAANGAIAKTTDAWKANATANGTAGWFRYVAGGHTVGGNSTTDIRFDGSIATSGGDLTLSSLTITANAVQTINTFTVTVPAS